MTAMRTVAYVEYALNRCAIADRVSSLTQRALGLHVCDYIYVARKPFS